MKKSIKTIFFTLCLCPAFILSACVPPPSYLITAKSSDIELGTVHGYKEKEMEEGYVVTLTANEINPFICWIKDDSLVAGTEKNLKLTYNEKTAGEYTAVFEENDISSMMYASLTSVNFEPNNYSSISYKISTALISRGSDNFSDFANGILKDGENTETDRTSIIKIDGIGQEYSYKILINLTLSNNQEGDNNVEFQISQIVDKTLFNDQGVCEITQYNENLNASITLTFEKLTYLMYHSQIELE